MGKKLFECCYERKKYDFKEFAKMLKKYDILGYILTIIYSVGLIAMSLLSFVYIESPSRPVKILILVQFIFGLYLLYTWTSGYRMTARTVLNLFLHGNESVKSILYDDHMELMYDNDAIKTLMYSNIKNIRRGSNFYLISFGMEYAFLNYNIDDEDGKDKELIMFMGNLENNYCKKNVNKIAMKRALGMIVFSIAIISEIVFMIIM